MFIFSEFILFCLVYPSFMTSSSCDLSLFGLLIMGYTFLTKIGPSCVEGQAFLFSPATFHSVWGLWFMAPTRLFKITAESEQALLSYSIGMLCSFPKFPPSRKHKDHKMTWAAPWSRCFIFIVKVKKSICQDSTWQTVNASK